MTTVTLSTAPAAVSLALGAQVVQVALPGSAAVAAAAASAAAATDAQAAAEAAQTAAEAAESNAAGSASDAAASANAASASALAAGAVQDAMEAIATQGGVSLYYDTYALANADIASISADEVVMVFADENSSGKPALYQKLSGVLTLKLVIETGQAVATTRAELAALGDTAAALDQANLTVEDEEGPFIFSTDDRSSRVEYDWNQNDHVARAGDADGSTGAWQRPVRSAVRSAHGGDDEAAILSAYNLLVQFSDFHVLEIDKLHTTRGIGDLQPVDYSGITDLATLEAGIGLGTYVDGDLCKLVSGARYLVKDGLARRISTGVFNGDAIIVRHGGKRFGIKHAGGAAAGERAIALSISDGLLENLYVDGNHAYPASAPPGLNPAVLYGAEFDGYNFIARNCTLRGFANTCVRDRGVVGNMVYDSTRFAYSGAGMDTVRGSYTVLRSPLFEGLTNWGARVKHDLTTGMSGLATEESYRIKKFFINVDGGYSECSVATYTNLQVEGGYGVVWKAPVKWGSAANDIWDVKLLDNADSDEKWKPSEGSLIDLGPLTNPRIKMEERSAFNVFERTGLQRSRNELFNMHIEDDSDLNQVLWRGGDPRMVPFDGSVPGVDATCTGTTNWASKNGALANAVRARGGFIGINQDYHPSWTDGPSLLHCTDMDPATGGTAFNQTLSNTFPLAGGETKWIDAWMWIEAGQDVAWFAYDPVNLVYKNVLAEVVGGSAWTTTGAANVHGVYEHIRGDRKQHRYRLKLVNDATARTVRTGLRIIGPGEAWLGQMVPVTSQFAAPTAYYSGVNLGTREAPITNNTHRPAAALMKGGQVYNVTAAAFQRSNGSTWS